MNCDAEIPRVSIVALISGDLKNVAGLDLPIDEPKSADFVMEFAPDYSVSALAERVIHNIKIKEKKAEKT